MAVRRAAVGHFGLAALYPGEPVSNLRRKFVPIWLMHRYQVEAAAKLLGGLDSRYAVAGAGQERAEPVQPAAQSTALDSLIRTLDPAALDVPATLVPLLSAGWSGEPDRQFEIEIFRTAGGTAFDPLAATDAAATVTLDALLHPARLNRLVEANRSAPANPSLATVTSRLLALDNAAVATPALAEARRRIGTRILLALARVARSPELAPSNARLIEARLADHARLLATAPGDSATQRDWNRSMSRLLLDREALDALLARPDSAVKVPPGMPIGGDSEG